MILFLFLLGLGLLFLGGEWLVRGASRLAVNIGISPLIVGLTVVAFATSAPELAVSLQALTRCPTRPTPTASATRCSRRSWRRPGANGTATRPC